MPPDTNGRAPSFLQQVSAARRRDALQTARRMSPAVLEKQIAGLPRTRSLLKCLQNRRGPERLPIIIAEVKKASPSAGILRAAYDPAGLAVQYARGGAAAISVLTEPRYFLGNDLDLKRVRAAVRLPVLRKDFISTPYQILETRVWGADVVLLIVAALSRGRLRELYELARAIGLDVLAEAHSREELERALALPGAIIGINSRNLRTLRTDLNVARNLAQYIPANRAAVAESGIKTRRDIRGLLARGYKGFLIGESILRAGNVAAKLRRLTFCN